MVMLFLFISAETDMVSVDDNEMSINKTPEQLKEIPSEHLMPDDYVSEIFFNYCG